MNYGIEPDKIKIKDMVNEYTFQQLLVLYHHPRYQECCQKKRSVPDKKKIKK